MSSEPTADPLEPIASFHHLIGTPGARFVPRELGASFARVLGRTAIDEAQRLRYCGGWFWRDGDDPALVARLAEACEAERVECLRFGTPAPIPPIVTDRVVTADLEGGRIYLETPHELVDVEPSDLVALDIGVVGESRPARTAREQEMHRWAEGMLAGLSFPQVREALLSCDLARPNPQLFLAVAGREAFLRVERGTRFPTLVESAGPQALDGLLHFIDGVLSAAPPACALPEVTAFWRSGTIEPVLRHRVEESDQRLSWLRAYLEHGRGRAEDDGPNLDAPHADRAAAESEGGAPDEPGGNRGSAPSEGISG